MLIKHFTISYRDVIIKSIKINRKKQKFLLVFHNIFTNGGTIQWLDLLYREISIMERARLKT